MGIFFGFHYVTIQIHETVFHKLLISAVIFQRNCFKQYTYFFYFIIKNVKNKTKKERLEKKQSKAKIKTKTKKQKSTEKKRKKPLSLVSNVS